MAQSAEAALGEGEEGEEGWKMGSADSATAAAIVSDWIIVPSHSIEIDRHGWATAFSFQFQFLVVDGEIAGLCERI